MGHTVEPTGECLWVPKRRCLLREHEKRGLEGIICIVIAVQQPLADTPNEWAMPFHQQLECRTFTELGVAVEELSVAHGRQPAVLLQPRPDSLVQCGILDDCYSILPRSEQILHEE